jgi:hypothetical protein
MKKNVMTIKLPRRQACDKIQYRRRNETHDERLLRIRYCFINKKIEASIYLLNFHTSL